MTHQEMSDHTKNILAITLKHYLELKPLNKIAVSDIVKSCDINRQTFYYHFKDIYELLSWMYIKEGEDYNQRCPALKMQFSDGQVTGNWRDITFCMLDYLEKNSAVCQHVVSSEGRSYFEDFLYQNIYAHMKELVMTLNEMADVKETEEQTDFLAHYYTISQSALMNSWLSSDFRVSEDAFLKQLDVSMFDHANGTYLRLIHQKKLKA